MRLRAHLASTARVRIHAAAYEGSSAIWARVFLTAPVYDLHESDMQLATSLQKPVRHVAYLDSLLGHLWRQGGPFCIMCGIASGIKPAQAAAAMST